MDEFQDTDPLQAEILLLPPADDPGQRDWRAVRPAPGKLFLVGDPKQSIYRLPRADAALDEEVKERLRHVGAEALHLSTSFRSPPSIQSFVNLAFAPAMAADMEGSQAGYVPLDFSRPEIIGRPTLVALPVPRPYGDFGKVVNWRIDEFFIPQAVGRFCFLVGQGEWLDGRRGWRGGPHGSESSRAARWASTRTDCAIPRRCAGLLEVGDDANPRRAHLRKGPPLTRCRSL